QGIEVEQVEAVLLRVEQGRLRDKGSRKRLHDWHPWRADEASRTRARIRLENIIDDGCQSSSESEPARKVLAGSQLRNSARQGAKRSREVLTGQVAANRKRTVAGPSR